MQRETLFLRYFRLILSIIFVFTYSLIIGGPIVQVMRISVIGFGTLN